MTSRITDMRAYQGFIKPLQGLETYLKECGLKESLRQQVAMQASQINVLFHAPREPVFAD